MPKSEGPIQPDTWLQSGPCKLQIAQSFKEPEESDCNRGIKLASDQRYTTNPIDNLCAHILQSGDRERNLAIDALGRLKADSALDFLATLLTKCAQALVDPAAPLDLPGSSGFALNVGAEICLTLARFDNADSHRVLVTTCNRPGDRYLRAAAISALGFECNWHDEKLIRRYLKPHQITTFRVAAVTAVFNCSGPRLQNYKSLIMPLLADPSPCVVIAAIEVLALLMLKNQDIMPAMFPLLKDFRYCRTYRTTISEFVSSYFDD